MHTYAMWQLYELPIISPNMQIAKLYDKTKYTSLFLKYSFICFFFFIIFNTRSLGTKNT